MKQYTKIKSSSNNKKARKGFFLGFVDYIKNPQFWITFIFISIIAPIIVEWVKFQIPRWQSEEEPQSTQVSSDISQSLNTQVGELDQDVQTSIILDENPAQFPDWWIRECINANEWEVYPNTEFPVFQINLDEYNEMDCLNLNTLRFFVESNNHDQQSLRVLSENGTSWIFHDLNGESVSLLIDINEIDYVNNSSQFINADFFVGIGSPEPSHNQNDGDYIVFRRLKGSESLQICYSRNSGCSEVLFNEADYSLGFENISIHIIPSPSGGEIIVDIEEIGSLVRDIHFESGDILILGYSITNIDQQGNRYPGTGIVDVFVEFSHINNE